MHIFKGCRYPVPRLQGNRGRLNLNRLFVGDVIYANPLNVTITLDLLCTYTHFHNICYLCPIYVHMFGVYAPHKWN